ncbi:MAG: hypothetical protein OXH31_04925 [Gammaproteobacteria bacterium]|nr:hypothetical protein [Gammaproteobacteria bacterium]
MRTVLSVTRNLRTIAWNEFRILWFSINTWVFFLTITLVFSIVYVVEISEFLLFWVFGYYYDIPIGPKYFTASLMTWYLVLTTIGAIYLGTNLRVKNDQNWIYEVVESRPVSNLELVFGRLLCVTALMSLPVVFTLIFVSVFGYIDNLFDLAYGDSPEVWSVLAFVIWDIVPNLAFWGALAMFLTMAFRTRLAGALSTFVLYIGWCALSLGLPLEVINEPLRVPTVSALMQAVPLLPFWLLDSLQSFSAAALYPSELAPTFMTWPLVVQRLAMLLLTAAVVFGAANFFPRSQASRKAGPRMGITCVVIAITLLGILSFRAWFSIEQTAQWEETHAGLETSKHLDLEHVTGRVELRPGKFMSLDLTLRLRALDRVQAKVGIFALNPGLNIDDLFLNGTRVVDYEFKQGVLKVPWVSMVNTVELRVLARGKPNQSFAYMDAAINVAQLNGKQLRRFRNLGTKSSIFRSDYVVLLPGVHWYPTPGAATGRANLDETGTDFHTFDLKIATNSNWLVAAPGQRERILEGSSNTHRIQSLVPVPAITIVSSRFVRRAMTVDGVEFELLISPNHEALLEHFVGTEIDLKEWLTERLDRARALGLEYPYERFTVVEVPSSLRIFGGGWQMDSTLGPPGLFLVRESRLRSIRFEQDNFLRWDEGEQRRKFRLSSLLNELEYDLVAENPYVAISKNFLTNQTKPSGSGALALQFVLDRLVSQFVMEKETYFSIQDLLVSDLKDVYYNLWFGKEFAGAYFDQPSVWFSAESISLKDLEMLPDPYMRSKVLWHKGYAVIRTLRDQYDTNVLGTMFRELLEQHRGRTFSVEDLAKLTPKQNKPLLSVIGDLLFTTKAPGYIASRPSISLIDIPFGPDEYLTSFELYNEQESPGFIRVYDGDSPIYELEGKGVITEPVWFDAKQAKKITIRSNQPYRSLDVKPYFSRNREYLRIRITPPDEGTPWINESNIPPIVEHIDWHPSSVIELNMIVVDDLDLGFSIVHSTNLEQVQPILPRILEAYPPTSLFHEQYYLPEFPNDYKTNQWHRVKDSWGFGNYRPTFVRIKDGRGKTSARFVTELPYLGTWRLEYHVVESDYPDRYVRAWYDLRIISERKWPAGNLAITVKNGDYQDTTEFGFVGAENGWQPVGEYEIVENTVAVLVSDAAIGNKGTTVNADAIRWTYLDQKTKEEPAPQ